MGEFAHFGSTVHCGTKVASASPGRTDERQRSSRRCARVTLGSSPVSVLQLAVTYAAVMRNHSPLRMDPFFNFSHQ